MSTPEPTSTVDELVDHAMAGSNWLVGMIVALIGIFAAVRAAMLRSVRNEELLRKIQAELEPNHGSSLRDAVNRVEANHTELAGRVDANHQVVIDQLVDIFELISHLHGIDQDPHQGRLRRALQALTTSSAPPVPSPEVAARLRERREHHNGESG